MRTTGAPLVTTTVCSNCAARWPGVTSVQPSAASSAHVAPVERNGSIARTSPSHRTVWSLRSSMPGHARALPQVAAGAVALEVLDHREPVAPGPALHGPADVTQRLTGPGRGEGVAVGQPGGVEQPAGGV